MNRIPLGNKVQTPIQAQANAHPISLCSQSGIQSRPSPRAPNILTAIRPNIAANLNDIKKKQSNFFYLNCIYEINHIPPATCDAPLLNKTTIYRSSSREYAYNPMVNRADTNSNVNVNVKKN